MGRGTGLWAGPWGAGPPGSVSDPGPSLPQGPRGAPGSSPRHHLVQPAAHEAGGRPAAPRGSPAGPPRPHSEGGLRPPPAPLLLFLHSQRRGRARDARDPVLLTEKPPPRPPRGTASRPALLRSARASLAPGAQPALRGGGAEGGPARVAAPAARPQAARSEAGSGEGSTSVWSLPPAPAGSAHLLGKPVLGAGGTWRDARPRGCGCPAQGHGLHVGRAESVSTRPLPAQAPHVLPGV